jgi:hypothetical protein
MEECQPGIFKIVGLPFTAWLVETDVMAQRGQPILSLVSHVFLNEQRRIVEEMNRTGHGALLCYVLQQVRQFRNLGEDSAMQHKDSEYLGQLDDDLQTAVLDAIPPERILRRFKPEERLRGMSPEERLRGLSAEEMVDGLTEDELARLRDLLERRRGK